MIINNKDFPGRPSPKVRAAYLDDAITAKEEAYWGTKCLSGGPESLYAAPTAQHENAKESTSNTTAQNSPVQCGCMATGQPCAPNESGMAAPHGETLPNVQQSNDSRTVQRGAIELLPEVLPVTPTTYAEALAQMANILRIFSATDATEMLAAACLTVAKDADLDSQDVAFLEDANFHLKDAAANIYAC